MTTRHPRGLRRFLVLWTAAVLGAFASLAVAFLVTSARLGTVAAVIHSDANSLDRDHRFELALLSQRRDALLWRLTGEERYRSTADVYRSEADRWITRLREHVTTDNEMRQVEEIEAAYAKFRDRIAIADYDEIRPLVDRVLQAVERHRALNASQMDTSLAAGLTLARRVRFAALTITILGAIVLAAGTAALWRRVLRPALYLTEAAESLARGDLEARAQAARNDEMGTLVHTFNAMADAVRHRERERFEFVAGVAHDLKNPVVAIGGGARRMIRSDTTEDERREWLEIIAERAAFMESLVADLMDVLQVQTGKLTLHLERFDLVEAAVQAVHRQARLADSHVIRFDGAGSCHVRADRRRLDRVLQNLISNAVKYSPSGTEITVTIEATDRSVRLSIRDRGVGIPQTDLSRVFEPFTRLEHTRDMATGTGLGLATVKKVVEAHGGEIRIESRLGDGTSVTVALPLD